MKSINNSNSSEIIESRMTLKDYFKRIPEASAPRTEFLRGLAERTGVSFNTARSWFVYGMKPREERVIGILEEVTGIPREDMWED